jgi:2-O-(6-phospho-alpha-D-mannosyl)-D-glycerate hydrolase
MPPAVATRKGATAETRVPFSPMSRPTVHLIPHTHWDREWYLPLGGFRARLVPAVDGLLAQLEADPRIISFLLDGQTVLLEDYLALRPEQRGRVTALVEAGRLQLGPWYVLADEQIPAGESLIRNLLLGRRMSRGSSVPLYSPDAFGHPSCWPQLGLEFGIQYGALWRGVSAEVMGQRDLAWWEAPDGRQILIYHLPPDGYETGSNLLVPEDRLPDAWRRVAASILPRAATRHVALLVGADHHAPSPELGQLASRLAAIAPDCDFRFSRLDLFMEAAQAEAANLPVLTGEQRWSYGYTWTLQGVHGTRTPLKRRNSAIELLLTRVAEPLAALAAGTRGTGAILNQAWREVVQCHFHDTIGGCASDLVARAMAVRFDDAEAATREVVRTALERIAGHDPDLARERGPDGSRLVLWNPVPRSRGGVVLAEVSFFRRDVLVGPPGARTPRKGTGARPFLLSALREDGAVTTIAPQILEIERGLERADAPRHYPDQDEVDRVRIAFPLPDALPGLGGGMFELINGDSLPQEEFALAEGRLVWNGRVGLGVDSDGSAVLRVPGQAKPLAGLLALESEADIGDTYSFAPLPRETIRRARAVGRPRVTASGPLVAGLEWKVGMRCGQGESRGAGRLAASISVEAIGDSPVLHCRIELDNQARDHRVRLRLPTGLLRAPVLAGTQFGVVARPPVGGVGKKYPAETPVRTAPAHRFVAVAKGGRGLAVFAPGFFEYEWTARGDLLITLLRSVGELSKANLHTRPGDAGWPTPTPEAQCIGKETIEVGLAWITSTDLDAPERLQQLWEDRFLPPVFRWIRDYVAAAPPFADSMGLALEGEGLALSALKQADDGKGIVVRCTNFRAKEVTGRLRSARPLARASLIRADETLLGDHQLEDRGHTVVFTVGGSGLLSLRLDWAD